ncbi:MAG: hypothetical protein HYU36_20725 [Planctomycetes bacterium]|nr:hypothetical protein [Planctomycetota bacterium]
MNATLEDLGVPARGDTWLQFRMARHPRTGAEMALGSLSRGGFVVIDPIQRRCTQVRPAHSATEGWAIGQAPDGCIYQAASFGRGKENALWRWNWEGNVSELARELPPLGAFSLDVAPDGRVYIPSYSDNTLHRFDPARDVWDNIGVFAAFGKHVRLAFCGRDGWVYVSVTDDRSRRIVAVQPETGETFPVEMSERLAVRHRHADLLKDAAGHVLAGCTRWGREAWVELFHGRAAAIDPADVHLARTHFQVSASAETEWMTPLAFRDGSYIHWIGSKAVGFTDSQGRTSEIDLAIEDSPLRIFTVEYGGGRLWGGTFIPLTLFSMDPAGGLAQSYGNPTETSGEIYAMVWSHGKLYMASYTRAMLTRYDPGRPWRMDHSVWANPASLGLMKEDAPHLHRPHGKALAPDGRVFFAARGDYGCEDSGICRIEPETDEVTRWIYRETCFGALCFLPQSGQLLVSETRKGEEAIRFTLVSTETGMVLSSEVGIRDRGEVVSWLPSGGDWVYGLHSYRATIFAYSLSERRIVRRLEEMRFGDHCYNVLLFGPDGRIWGLTNDSVFAVDRELSSAERVAAYEDHAGRNFYRFGMVYGPDGHLYFPNGTHLMRLRITGTGESSRMPA